MMMKIPLGFHFAPSDEELITSYLLRRAMALPLMPSGYDEHRHILETSLYGEKADPWLVFQDVPDSRWEDISDDEDGKDKRVIYVVTKLTKISKGKTRIARRAGCGTWSGQTPPKKIYDESTGQWVGSMRMLSFERAKGEVQYHDPRDQHHWIMHEFSLDGIYNNNSKVDKDYVICRITRLFKGNKYSTNNDIINGTSAQQLVPAAAVPPPCPCPNKKRKREIINTQQLVDQERQLRSRLQLEHTVVVSSSAGEEEDAHHEYPPPVMAASNDLQVEYISMPAETMAHHEASNQQMVELVDEDCADFDKWMSSLDDVLLDLPEEDQNYLHSSDINHNNTTIGIAAGDFSLGEQQEDHTQAATSKQLQVESVSVLEMAPQKADDDLFEASTTIAADWMRLLDDVDLPDEDEDQNSNHNNWTTTGFNLDHLDLFEELCY